MVSTPAPGSQCVCQTCPQCCFWNVGPIAFFSRLFNEIAQYFRHGPFFRIFLPRPPPLLPLSHYLSVPLSGQVRVRDQLWYLVFVCCLFWSVVVLRVILLVTVQAYLTSLGYLLTYLLVCICISVCRVCVCVWKGAVCVHVCVRVRSFLLLCVCMCVCVCVCVCVGRGATFDEQFVCINIVRFGVSYLCKMYALRVHLRKGTPRRHYYYYIHTLFSGSHSIPTPYFKHPKVCTLLIWKPSQQTHFKSFLKNLQSISKTLRYVHFLFRHPCSRPTSSIFWRVYSISISHLKVRTVFNLSLI